MEETSMMAIYQLLHLIKGIENFFMNK